jgi:hypothetical protein
LLDFGLRTHQNTSKLFPISNLNRYYSSTSEETSNEDAEKPAEGIYCCQNFIQYFIIL